MMPIFHLNTTVVAIFPNVCLWRRSLCSDLVLTLKTRIEPPSYARTALCCCNMALISFRLFRKHLGNLRVFFGQMVYRPPWPKSSHTRMIEVDWKKAEQKIIRAIFQLDNDQLTSILLSHWFWIFQSTFKLQLMILAAITVLWAFLNCFLLFLAIFF